MGWPTCRDKSRDGGGLSYIEYFCAKSRRRAILALLEATLLWLGGYHWLRGGSCPRLITAFAKHFQGFSQDLRFREAPSLRIDTGLTSVHSTHPPPKRRPPNLRKWLPFRPSGGHRENESTKKVSKNSKLTFAFFLSFGEAREVHWCRSNAFGRQRNESGYHHPSNMLTLSIASLDCICRCIALDLYA